MGASREWDGVTNSDVITISNEAAFDFTTTMTLLCWIKRTGSTGFWQAAVSKSNGSDAALGWFLAVDNRGAGKVEFSGVTSAAPNRLTKEGDLTGGWDRIAVRVNAAEGTVANRIKLYVNGVEAATTYSTGTFSGFGVNNMSVLLGNQTGTTRTLKGLLANVAFFNATLSEQLCEEYLWNPWKIPASGTVAQFPLWGVDSPETNLSGMITGTVSGPTESADGPPVSWGPAITVSRAGTATAGLSIPIAAYHHNHNIGANI